MRLAQELSASTAAGTSVGASFTASITTSRACVAVRRLELQRARRQQHPALAPVGRLVDQAGGKDCSREWQARPSSRPWRSGSRAPPAKPRSTTAKLFIASSAIATAATDVVGALRLDEQAAQAQQPRILARRHGLECRARGVAIAFELRRLGMQQQRQRIGAGMAACNLGMGTRGGRIAVTDRKQTLRDRVPASRMTPLAARPCGFSPAAATAHARRSRRSLRQRPPCQIPPRIPAA